MPTVVGICNRALLRVGSSAFISAIDDETAEAEVLAQVYEPARDELLELFPWPFATMEVTLAVVEDIERSGWTYAYGVPTECLNPRRIYAGLRAPKVASKIPFEVVAAEDLESRYLLCDLEEAVLIYTARVENPTMFSPLFADALAWRIAVDLAMQPARADYRQQAAVGYAAALSTAQASMLNAQHEAETESDIITSRG